MTTQTTYKIGSQPGNGKYLCQRCHKYVAQLLGPEEQLPPCEECGSDDSVEYCAIDKEAYTSHGPN